MKISVITVCYNAQSEIEKTLLSVIKQTYDNFEYIVVDGKSTDGTVKIIQKYHTHISKWVSEPDTGIYNAMNKGVRLATGEYCIFMNAGDTFATPDALKLSSLFLNDGFDILVGREISTKGNKIIDYIYPPDEITPIHLYLSSLSHQSSFIKREVLLANPYDETLRLVSDWKFWIETLLIQKLRYRAIDVDVSCFNHDGATFNQVELGRKERQKVLAECMPKDMLVSCQKQTDTFPYSRLISLIKREIRHKPLIQKFYRQLKNEVKEYKRWGTRHVLLEVFAKVSPYFNKRMHAYYMDYVRKYYKDIVLNSSVQSNAHERVIWVCWWQGEAYMPLIPKLSLLSIKRYAKNIPVIVVSKDNYKKYAKMPDYIEEHLKNGDISITHFSDVLRFVLLSTHGGLWIDATDIVTGDITKYCSLPFFTNKQNHPNDSRYISGYKWASHLIGGESNIIFSSMRDCFFEYFRREKYVMTYFLLDYFLALIYETREEARKIIDDVDYNNEGILDMMHCINDPINPDNFNQLWSNSLFHKLTWKKRIVPYTQDKIKTCFGYLIDRLF